jgi:nicotinate-nucleotide pyrophosphorylase (carboxylating)
MILIKDNHIDASGLSAAQLLRKVHAHKPPEIPIEIEVRNFNEFQSCLQEGKADRIMLDNFSLEEGKQAFQFGQSWTGKSVEIEISGGMNEEKIAQWVLVCAPWIVSRKLVFSMGALTNQARCLDISLKIQKGSA